MKKVVRFIAQCIDSDSGDIIEEAIMNEESLSKAETLPPDATFITPKLWYYTKSQSSL